MQNIKQTLELHGFTNDVLLDYNLKVIDVLPIREVLELKTTTGDFVIKKFKLSKDELFYSLAAMRHIKQKGFPVPNIIPACSGELFIEKNGMKYFVMECLKGQEIRYSDKNCLSLATQSLAFFHRATHGFAPPYCPGKSQWGTWKVHFKDRIKEMLEWKDAAQKEDTLFCEMYAKQVDHWIEEALYAIDLLSNSRYQEISLIEHDLRGFCHHDLAYHNILITDENRIALVDFDYAISDIRTHDLASLILRNMKETKWDWDLEKALFIIKNYFKVAQPYVGEERLIHAMLRFPQYFYESGYFYFVEKSTNIERLETRLIGWEKHQKSRERFLKKFEKSARHFLKH
jgi:CotS family spore coat protein